jgi:hypothetical protein
MFGIFDKKKKVIKPEDDMKKKDNDLKNQQQEIKNKINKLRKEFETDANNTKYRIREDKYLDILFCSNKDAYYLNTYTYHLNTFRISKNKKLLIQNNGAFSLNDTFTIGPINRVLNTSSGIDDTNYTEICIIASGISVILCGYSFDNEFFKEYKEQLEQPYLDVAKTFAKIFNDASGNFDYKEVRASQKEEEIMNNLLIKK